MLPLAWPLADRAQQKEWPSEELTRSGKGEGEVGPDSPWAWLTSEQPPPGQTVSKKRPGVQGPRTRSPAPSDKWFPAECGPAIDDGSPASGNALGADWSRRWHVPPLSNVRLVPNYKDGPHRPQGPSLQHPLRNQFPASRTGRGANLLMWNSEDVQAGANLLGVESLQSEESGPSTRAKISRLRPTRILQKMPAARLPEGAPKEEQSPETGDRKPYELKRKNQFEAAGSDPAQNNGPTVPRRILVESRHAKNLGPSPAGTAGQATNLGSTSTSKLKGRRQTLSRRAPPEPRAFPCPSGGRQPAVPDTWNDQLPKPNIPPACTCGNELGSIEPKSPR